LHVARVTVAMLDSNSRGDKLRCVFLLDLGAPGVA
jgi:hypothetical protein